MWKRESKVLGDQLLKVWTTELFSLFYFIDLEDLIKESIGCSFAQYSSGAGVVVLTYVDRSETSAMSCSHIGVHRVDGFSPRQFTVLLVHVVCARARIVTKPHSEVLDLLRPLLIELY
jgi:hypothetical protein